MSTQRDPLAQPLADLRRLLDTSLMEWKIRGSGPHQPVVLSSGWLVDFLTAFVSVIDGFADERKPESEFVQTNAEHTEPELPKPTKRLVEGTRVFIEPDRAQVGGTRPGHAGRVAKAGGFSSDDRFVMVKHFGGVTLCYYTSEVSPVDTLIGRTFKHRDGRTCVLVATHESTHEIRWDGERSTVEVSVNGFLLDFTLLPASEPERVATLPTLVTGENDLERAAREASERMGRLAWVDAASPEVEAWVGRRVHYVGIGYGRSPDIVGVLSGVEPSSVRIGRDDQRAGYWSRAGARMALQERSHHLAVQVDSSEAAAPFVGRRVIVHCPTRPDVDGRTFRYELRLVDASVLRPDRSTSEPFALREPHSVEFTRETVAADP